MSQDMIFDYVELHNRTNTAGRPHRTMDTYGKGLSVSIFSIIFYLSHKSRCIDVLITPKTVLTSNCHGQQLDVKAGGSVRKIIRPC